MTLSKTEREKLRMMFGGKCAYCECDLHGRNWQPDHVKAVWRDGRKMLRPENDRKDNLYPACISCNRRKSMGTVEDFRKAIESDPAMLLRDSAKFEMAVRFGTVHVDSAPVVFWYETYRAARRHE